MLRGSLLARRRGRKQVRNLKVFKGLLQMSTVSEFYLFTEITLHWRES
jgi:hypothetical protein